MKLLVTGTAGQLAMSLCEAAPARGFEFVAVGRPDLDLLQPGTIEASIARTAPDIVVNAAAYTAVDRAESEPQLAHAINAEGAGHVAAACECRGIPVIHISTDYVFDGLKSSRYIEHDPVGPMSVYGRSKLEGEQRAASHCRRLIILRTAWVHSPFGTNFVRTMLHLATTRSEIGVVSDQIGCPTYAPHLADAILRIAVSVVGSSDRQDIWGVYHATAQGEATWHEFADEIFRCSSERGGPATQIHPISTADYPTPAKRPANSRLDCRKLASVFDLELPHWRQGTEECVSRLVRNE